MPYHHFTREEQYIIAHMSIAGFSLREIGRRLQRHHTSISREIIRNRPTYADDAVYWYDAAEFYAKERRRKPRHRRRHHQRLVAYVRSKVRLDWSPEAISGRLKAEYANDAKMRISHETIYRWIYLDSRNKGDLHSHLRRRHKYRRRQRRYGSGNISFKRSSFRASETRPGIQKEDWIPAFAGMTKKGFHEPTLVRGSWFWF